MIQTIGEVVRKIKKDLKEKEVRLHATPEAVFEEVIYILLLFPSYNMYLEFKSDIIELIREKEKSCKIDADGIIDFCQRSAELIHSAGEEMIKAEAMLKSLVQEDTCLFAEPVSIKPDDLQLLHLKISECIRSFLKEFCDSFQQAMEKFGITAMLADEFKNFRELRKRIEKLKQERRHDDYNIKKANNTNNQDYRRIAKKMKADILRKRKNKDNNDEEELMQDDYIIQKAENINKQDQQSIARRKETGILSKRRNKVNNDKIEEEKEESSNPKKKTKVDKDRKDQSANFSIKNEQKSAYSKRKKEENYNDIITKMMKDLSAP